MKFCLIGEHLSHSYSKEIHNATGVDYVLKEVSRCGVGDFVTNSTFDGFNVTIPYKKDVMPFLDEISKSALGVGAVNTVARKNGKLLGFNTDVDGFLYMVSRKGVNLENKSVLILGTGGASKAVYYACKLKGAKEINVVGRTSEVNYENCYEKPCDIIINATPVGMYPEIDGTPIDLTRFSRLEAVFDLIYNPQKTNLLKKAEELSIVNSNGLSMLVEQALLAQDIWFDKTHTESQTEEIISQIAKRNLNVVLTGMPSCGKSTIGKKLAKKLNKKFIDLDIFIKDKIGKSPADIITEYGEAYFRKIESECVKEVSGFSGTVIALGGGAFISETNRYYLSLNSVTVYIKRDLSLLSTKGRPLSQNQGVNALYEKRKQYYESADLTAVNNGKISSTVTEIIKSYETTCNKWS